MATSEDMDKMKTKSSNSVPLEDWKDAWKGNRLGWHFQCINPILEKHMDSLIGQRKNIKMFFPLCGKSVDMKWMYDLGHEVVGVEISELACRQFFTEQNIEFTEEDVQSVNGKVYRSKDKRISLYSFDLFLFNKDVHGTFEAVFDRGAFEAIDKIDRKKYADTMGDIMAPGGRILLTTFDYDPNEYGGPPHNIPEEDVNKYFGEVFSIKHLEKFVDEYSAAAALKKRTGMTWLDTKVDLLTRKS